MSWSKKDLFAITFDGTLLMNADTLDETDLAKLMREEPVFIGIPIGPREARRLRKNLRDACSEAAANISGGRLWRPRRSR